VGADALLDDCAEVACSHAGGPGPDLQTTIGVSVLVDRGGPFRSRLTAIDANTDALPQPTKAKVRHPTCPLPKADGIDSSPKAGRAFSPPALDANTDALPQPTKAKIRPPTGPLPKADGIDSSPKAGRAFSPPSRHGAATKAVASRRWASVPRKAGRILRKAKSKPASESQEGLAY
jgi:hypothetical protein